MRTKCVTLAVVALDDYVCEIALWRAGRCPDRWASLYRTAVRTTRCSDQQANWARLSAPHPAHAAHPALASTPDAALKGITTVDSCTPRMPLFDIAWQEKPGDVTVENRSTQTGMPTGPIICLPCGAHYRPEIRPCRQPPRHRGP